MGSLLKGTRMTTIAWDGKTLAADRQAHHGPSNTKYECKKLRVLNGRAIAGAGIKCLNDAMASWIAYGGDLPEACKQGEYTVVVANAENECEVYEGVPIPLKIPAGVKLAWGSGAQAAMAAMECGKDAREAIEIASRVDLDTGCGIDSHTF